MDKLLHYCKQLNQRTIKLTDFQAQDIVLVKKVVCVEKTIFKLVNAGCPNYYINTQTENHQLNIRSPDYFICSIVAIPIKITVNNHHQDNPFDLPLGSTYYLINFFDTYIKVNHHNIDF